MFKKKSENWGVGGRMPAHTPIFGHPFSSPFISGEFALPDITS
jgi:hypothetical protein